MFKKDNFRFGLLIGFLVPLLGTVVYYFVRFKSIATVQEFGYYLLHEKHLFTAMISILLVANIACLTYYLNTRRDNTAKGIFAASCVYGIASLVWKLMY